VFIDKKFATQSVARLAMEQLTPEEPVIDKHGTPLPHVR
jgi:hypothetical protein